mgnify:CR=1 FL=1
MRIGYAGRWLALGTALVLVSACEAADRRFEQFGELADSVFEQINTEILGKAPADPLMSAPLEQSRRPSCCRTRRRPVCRRAARVGAGRAIHTAFADQG